MKNDIISSFAGDCGGMTVRRPRGREKPPTVPFNDLGMETPYADMDELRRLVAKARRPGQRFTTVVEIGSWAGRTALAMEEAGAAVWCVDTWAGSEGDPGTTATVAEKGPDHVFATFCENTRAKLFQTIFPCRGPSLLWASIWPSFVDMVFIDGDHRYDAVKADIAAWLPKVRPGGILCGHDYFIFEDVRRAVDELVADHIGGVCVWSKGIK